VLESKIRKVAMDLDNALERKDIDFIVSCFTTDCAIELSGIKLKGRKGVRKWLEWMLGKVESFKLTPVVIMVDNEKFFEEFIVKATLKDGTRIVSKQAEVLIYKNYKVKSLRLYFDRLDFVDAVAKDPVSKMIAKQIIKKSLEGLK
jgi:hypothetical protein